MLSQFTYQGDFLDSHCNIEDFISKLVNAMMTVSQRTVPIVSHLRGAKPYWSPQLTQLSRQQRTVRGHWIADGRPRDDHHDTWWQYKAANREFQRVQREAEYRYNIEAMEELAESEQIDQRYFWYPISKSRKSASNDSKRLQPTRGVDGTLLYDPDAVSRSWETYYVDLHTPKDLPEYDDVHKAFVTETVSALPQTPPSESFRTKLSTSGNIIRPMFWNPYLCFVWADFLDILQYLTTIYWEYIPLI